MQQLSAQDASFVYMESPAAPMHVGSLCIYDGSAVDPERLTEEAVTRMVDERLHLNVTTRRRLARVPFEADYPYWVEDAGFDLEYHVRRVALPKPGDRLALQKLASRIFSRPLDMTKPLWELYVIEGLDHIEGIPAGSFAVLTKTHHAAVDGASGLHFLELLHDLTPAGSKIPLASEPWRPDPYPTDAELLMRSGFNHMNQPMRFFDAVSRQFQQSGGLGNSANKVLNNLRQTATAQTGNTTRRVPKTRFNGAVTAHRVLGTTSFSLDDIRSIRQLVDGATVNDAILAICGGALRRYLESKNELDAESLIATAPVNLRAAGDSTAGGGNRVGALFVPVGTDVADGVARLAHIHNETSNSKLMHNAVGAASMTDYAEFVPAFTAALASRLMTETAANAPVTPFNVSITNVPGPQQPLYFCGAPMITAIGLGPISQGMGLIFPVLSYCGRITVSFTSCREILPDPEFFEGCLVDTFNDLLAAAKKAAAASAPSQPAGAKTQADSTPAEEMPAADAPAKEAPAAEAPRKAVAESAVVREVPKSAPAAQPPVRQSPSNTAPAVKTPTAEAPKRTPRVAAQSTTTPSAKPAVKPGADAPARRPTTTAAKAASAPGDKTAKPRTAKPRRNPPGTSSGQDKETDV